MHKHGSKKRQKVGDWVCQESTGNERPVAQQTLNNGNNLLVQWGGIQIDENGCVLFSLAPFNL